MIKPSNEGQRGGFTLIELLLVVGIIIILASLIFPAIEGAMEKGHYTRWKAHSSATRGETGLIAYYNFEDGIGQTKLTNLAAGDLANFTPDKGDGTLTGAAIARENSRWPGQGKGGVYFDGTAASNMLAPEFERRNDGKMAVTLICWMLAKSSGPQMWQNGAFCTVGNSDNPNRCQIELWTAGPMLTGDNGRWNAVEGRQSLVLRRT